MKIFWPTFCIIISFQFSEVIHAYEIETHEEISIRAFNNSVLNESGVLSLLGYEVQGLSEEKLQEQVRDFVANGAKFEDNGSRPANHFFDPTRGSPLRSLNGFNNIADLGETSPDWALEDTSESEDIQGQDNSYNDAVDYFYDALTKPTEAERNEQFEKLFTTLGQVIHHLQDMAQPQHVRNDAHCGEWFCKISIFLHNPSLYEIYTEGLEDNIPFGNRDPVTLDTARAYWLNAADSGIAEFTNRNFVSDATNFSLDENDEVNENANYEFPKPEELPTTKHISELIPGTSLDGYVDFYGTVGTDELTGEPINNARASSLSYFDDELTKRNLKKEIVQYPLEIQVLVEYRVFTLNRFNFKAAHDFLIPRAVSYSSGLINHFFRSRLEIEEAKIDSSQIIIKVINASKSDQTFYGDGFQLFYDATDGERKRIEPITISSGQLPLNVNASLELTVSLPDDVDINKEKPYMLVFNGSGDDKLIGQEQGVAAINFVPEEESGTGNRYYFGFPGLGVLYDSLGACVSGSLQPVFDDEIVAPTIEQAENSDPNGWDAEVTQDLTKIASSNFFNQPPFSGRSGLYSERHNYQGIITRYYKSNGVRNGQQLTTEHTIFCVEHICTIPGLVCNFDEQYGGL